MSFESLCIKEFEYIVDKALMNIKSKAFKKETQVDFEAIKQDGMIALLRAIKNYKESKGVFEKYAYCIVYRVMNYKFKKEIKTDYNVPLDNVMYELNYDDNFDIDIEFNQIKRIICLSNLSFRNKQLLLDRLNGAQTKDLANKYNITSTRVYQILHKGYEAIKEEL